MPTLRPYQIELSNAIDAAWSAGHRNVLAVLPTGGGKTVVFSSIVERAGCIAVAMAHRSELIGQMSLALARNGLRHRVIAPPQVRAEIEAQHVEEFGRRFIDPHSNVIAAGVHSLVNHPEPWMQKCGLWICDEAHHLGDKANVWGRAVAMLPNARGLGVTATPVRADGKGLGRHADGVFDAMVVGPGMRDLIDAGYLADYRIFAPRSDLDLSKVAIGASGDYVGGQLRDAVHASHLTGDTVAHYLRLAKGKLGITFTVDIETAEQTAKAYRAAGVNAEVLTGKTPTAWRAKVMRAFRAREVLQICNCDLLGEGTDVPAVEVVSFARPTASYGLYVQQFGRALRTLEGKAHAIIIDHAGNVLRHGLPDAYREWSLDARERRSRGTPAGVIPVTTCTQCSAVFERIYSSCPYCGHQNQPAQRSAPHFVDGDLAELDADTLAALRGEVARIDGAPRVPQALSPIAAAGLQKQHHLRQVAQKELRDVLALYGGWRTAAGDTLSIAQRRFYLTFGIDVMSAQALGRSEAEALKEKIDATLASRR